MAFIIGVDIGGTLIRAACFDHDLVMLERAEQPTLAHEGTDAVVDRICETITQVLPEDHRAPTGIGIATPGPIDARRGAVITTPNLPFRDTPIKDLVAQRFGVPVHVGNDADLAGLAEYTHGAGRGAQTMIYLTISTGVGGGIVIGGRPLIGGGLAGEIGHMVIDPNGPMCNCGHQGHLEAFASGTAMAQLARERIAAGQESTLTQMVGGRLDQITASEIGAAAQAGDRLAHEIVHRAGWHIGVAIASLMVLLNPEVFVLGGGVTRIGDLLFAPIHEAISHYTLHERYWRDVPILPAQLGGDAGLTGAAALVLTYLRGT